MAASSKHTGIYISNYVDKQLFIQKLQAGTLLSGLDLSALKGVVFSDISLNDFIQEEVKHEHLEIVTDKNKGGLATMSSGQQKKALIIYLLSKKPQYLILDDLFAFLDEENRNELTQVLHNSKDETLIIQLFNRKNELLPFIETIFQHHEKTNSFVPKQLSDINSFTHHAVEADYQIPIYLKEQKAVNEILIEFKNVSLSYDTKAVLNNISWTIRKGEFWHLIGPNGSGKSTILSMINGDNPKAYGQEIYLFGRKKGSGETIWDIKANLGFYSSNMTFKFERNETVENMVISGFYDSVGLYIKPSDLQIHAVHEWLKLVDLYEFRKKSFHSLSFGLQRIVLIIRALIKQAPLLILDEPGAGLDEENMLMVSRLINKIVTERKTSILYVSHKEELGLTPNHILKLTPGPEGSTAEII